MNVDKNTNVFNMQPMGNKGDGVCNVRQEGHDRGRWVEGRTLKLVLKNNVGPSPASVPNLRPLRDPGLAIHSAGGIPRRIRQTVTRGSVLCSRAPRELLSSHPSPVIKTIKSSKSLAR